MPKTLFRVRTAACLVSLVSLILLFVPLGAQAADGSKLVFAYQQATVSQDVGVSSVIAGGSTLTATVSAAEVQDWKASSDTLAVGIQLLGSGGGSIYSHNTGFITLTDGGVFNDYSISVTAAGVGAGWNSVATARIFIIGGDGEFWAGNYGTQVESASLKLDGTELLSNTEFITNSGWSSSLGWSTCSANSGYQPCIGISAVQINNASTTTTSTTTTSTTTTTTTLPPAPLDGSACAESFVSSDFAYGGVASNTSGTVQLTPASGNQFGAIWNKERVDVSQDMCIRGELYLGNNDGGADGLALVIQPNSVAAGSTGGGLGYAGITPSFAVEFDTWPNSGDMYNDHSALVLNGSTTAHTTWTNPVDLGDIEDGQWRTFKFYWDATGQDVTVFYDTNADGDTTDSGEIIFDEVSVDLASIFSSSSGIAYWGFTAATGGANNTQSVRNITYDVVTRTNVAPTMPTAPADASVQASQSTTVNFVLNDDSTTSGQWVVTATSSNTSVVANNELSASMTSATAGQLVINPSSQRSAGTSTITLSATDADGLTVTSTFVVTVTAAPNALIVSSLADTNTSGTLRWAINQANAQSGGMYDAIEITTQGTITLTADLPAITQGVSISGTGMNTTIIDGNNLYRAIYNNGSRTIVIEDMTFKQGKNVSWNGGLIYNASGTMTFNRIKISNHSSWAFYQGGGGVTTFNNSQFTNNGYAITSDHGSTPTSLSLVDTNYTNRIYINDSVFTSNTYGIRTERFTKIQNSQFTSNTYGAILNGLNRQQVINSTFTNNAGAAVYFSSWIPTTWTPGAGNQTVSGSSFNGNGVAIQFANNFNNGANTYNGVSANSWSTSTNNTFGATSPNTTNYSGSGYISTGDTITVSTICAPRNLTVIETGNNIVLDWDAPNCGTRQPERYAIFFTTGELAGWGVATGNVGDANALNTEYTFAESYFNGFDVPAGSTWRFSVRSDNDTLGLYSDRTDEASIAIGTPPTTTTTTTTTTTVPAPQPEPTPEPTPETTPEPVDTTPETTTPETDSVPDEQNPLPEVTVPSEESPGPDSGPETENTSPESQPEPEDQPQTTEEEIEPSIETITESILENIENIDSAEEIPEIVQEAIAEGSPEEVAEIATILIEGLIESDASPEEVAAIVESLIENIAEDSDALTLSDEDKEKVSAVVDAVLESGIDEESAATLAASAVVLASIDTTQAEAIFETVDAGALTEAAAGEIVDAVQNATEEIRDVFEDAVDLFQGVFDDYTMLGQTVNVGQRRTIVAVNLLATTTAALATAGGAMAPSSGGSPSSPSGSAKNDIAARKEDEEESEAAGEIAGDGLDWIKKLSIYKTVNGEKIMDWKAFIKKFWLGLLNMGFTLAGSLVVYLTLTGPIQKIAGISTVLAIAAAMYLHMKEPDGE